MNSQTITLGNTRIEVLTDGDRFVGIGKCWIGQTQVRSGRLPIRVGSQTFTGHQIDHLKFVKVESDAAGARIRTKAVFRPMPVKLLRDHSFDPIYDLGDWSDETPSGYADLDIVLRPAGDSFEGVGFSGFAYHFEYNSQDMPIFHLMEQSTWELDGDITGATVVSQSSGSDPIFTAGKDNAWSTEAAIYWAPDMFNPHMTHNLPRWASHQAFDFQYKGGRVLLGVFERVDLIRTTMVRDAGKPELKCFDKHIFDQTKSYKTSARKILLIDTPARTETDVRNIWTWVIDEVHNRARAEFGMTEVKTTPRLSQNYWANFTIDTYYRDVLPAAINCGFKELFLDNLNKNDDNVGTNVHNGGNMCCGHEYETSPKLGGPKALKRFIDDCKKHGIRVMSWTNNDQSNCSPLFRKHRDHNKGASWFVHMEDTRLTYGGAYTDVFGILDFKKKEPREYWMNCLKKIKQESGLDGYLFDSFYNLGFMPVNYEQGRCTTQWRETIQAFAELQKEGIEFLIESFGPWGQPQHGCPRSYSLDRAWVVYKVQLGNDYTTVPTGQTHEDPRSNEAAAIYYALAHKISMVFGLFKNGKRIDEIWTDAHKQALRDYHAHCDAMHKRFLQEDGLSVLWHDKAGKQATLFNFADREVKLPGEVTDATAGQKLPKAEKYKLQASHTYTITGTDLPTRVG
jgi:hypothetical protein